MIDKPMTPIKLIVPLDGSALAEQAISYARALSTGTADVVPLSVLPHGRPVHGLLGDVKVSAEVVIRRAVSDVTEQLVKMA